jgi:hypothetical protein
MFSKHQRRRLPGRAKPGARPFDSNRVIQKSQVRAVRRGDMEFPGADSLNLTSDRLGAARHCEKPVTEKGRAVAEYALERRGRRKVPSAASSNTSLVHAKR